MVIVLNGLFGGILYLLLFINVWEKVSLVYYVISLLWVFSGEILVEIGINLVD